MTHDPVLEAAGLRRRYGDRVAVDGVDLRVHAGEVVGLVGANGAGKTTLLRLLCGVVHPDAGTVRILGRDLRREPVAAKRALAFVPDEPELFDALSVDEHLQLASRLYGAGAGPAERTAMLAALDLAGRADALPHALSRGMRQKVLLAAALLHRPALLVLDEPLTGLDPVALAAVKRLLRAHADGGGALLLSSHLLPLVEELCGRVVVLHSGRVVADAAPAALRAGATLESAVTALLA